jgi:uncharacterized membrane protein
MAAQGRSTSAPAGLVDTAVSPSAQQEWRLSPARRKLLLVTHLVGAIGFFGSSLAVLVLTAAGANGADAKTVYPAAQMLTVWLILPLAIVALVTGVTQATLSPWGLTRYWWVAIKLLITVVLAVFIFVTIYPRIASAAGSALGHSAQPVTGAERSRILSSWPFVCALLIVNLFLAIYKPRRRLRSGGRQHDAPVLGEGSAAGTDGD